MKKFYFQCSNCGTDMIFLEHQAGIEGPCGGCGETVVTPLPMASDRIPIRSFQEAAPPQERAKKNEEMVGRLILASGHYIELNGRPLRFGTDSHCEVVCHETYGMATQQFKIVRENDLDVMVNLDKQIRPTKVNYVPVGERQLKDGDIIFAGLLEFSYQAPLPRYTPARWVTTSPIVWTALIIGMIYLAYWGGDKIDLSAFASQRSEEAEPFSYQAQSEEDENSEDEEKIGPTKELTPVSSVIAGVSKDAAPEIISAIQTSRGNSKADPTQQELAEGNRLAELMMSNYLEHGDRHWKWDADALDVLALYARFQTSEVLAVHRNEMDQLVAKVGDCLNLGCEDPMIIEVQNWLSEVGEASQETQGGETGGGPIRSLGSAQAVILPG